MIRVSTRPIIFAEAVNMKRAQDRSLPTISFNSKPTSSSFSNISRVS